MSAAPITYSTIFKLALAATLLFAAGLLGTGLWMANGAALFLALAESSLSWCL
ncbi:hypothetical protein GCM10023174_18700 [Chelativorans composti]|jgi:hypothetical protein|uniref:Uncharacterized protein n=1 Tax=Chelativorans composti TaxID=768533 RepID=A0ABW5DH32_9HYPH|nr:hypothetical protein [bacterium SGD-2]